MSAPRDNDEQHGEDQRDITPPRHARVPAWTVVQPRSAEPQSADAAGPDDRLRILLLCNYDPRGAATVCDHINAFHTYSRHEVTVYSRIGELADWLSFDDFDVVVVHYSSFIGVNAYVTSKTRHRLARFQGLKAIFLQDEYRFVDRTSAAIREAGISLVFTCVPTAEISKVYPAERFPGVRFVNVLTGYVAEGLKLFQPKPLAERKIMVGYRGRVYPAWHGPAGREKFEIGRRFRTDAKQFGLRCDIAWDESRRLYGLDWVDFIRDCRAVLAVESGASVFDFDGTISARTEAFVRLLGLAERPRGKSLALLSAIGWPGKGLEEQETYEELRRRFFAGNEDAIDLAQLSPRVFEAITLQTLLIMYEGRYSGILEPWRHFLPLKKDHSNMAEIVAALRDPVRVAEIIATCYAEIAENPAYSYERFIRHVDAVTETAMTGRPRAKAPTLSQAQFYEKAPFYHVEYPHSVAGGRRRNLTRAAGAARAALKKLLRS